MLQKPKENPQSEAKPPKTSLFDAYKLHQPLQSQDAEKRLIPLATMSLPELLELRAHIDELLPPRKLSELDLEEEVLLQFARTKKMYDDVAEDDKTPANQKAQIANSCTAILDQLIKMQKALYSAERVKALEQALIKTLKECDDKTQARFFELYERNLANVPVKS